MTIHPTAIRLPAASPRDDSDLNPRRDPPLDFRDRPLAQMAAADYAELGFISGLEVHQQLATKRKLFCRCPAGVFTANWDAEVLRHMRPTLSELGQYDACALMEFKTRKDILYRLHRSSVCTYELDDTPPFEIDPAAVDGAIELSLMLNLQLVSELHVMRKQYLDGSIPTGFQRTALIGIAGVVPFRVPALGVDRELRIRQLSLEEDSCREVSDVGHTITFRTDRLGMPLTEAVTEPDLVTPWELQAGAQLMAATARATGRARRGSGAARQDVNVSIAGGRRVEIKGVGYHLGLPLLVHNEGFRQLNLLRIMAELQRRDADRSALELRSGEAPWEVTPLVVDARSSVRGSGDRSLQAALDGGRMVAAVRLPGFAGLLAERTQPGLSFAHEIGERVRVIACPDTRDFMCHSDDPERLGSGVWREVRAALGAKEEDCCVLVWGAEADAAMAAREVLSRAREAYDGVPSETRQALPGGTTGFERILPGPERMYPDTDTPPLAIGDARVARIESRLAERPWLRRSRYEALGLDPELASRLSGQVWASLFDSIAPASGEVARRLAFALAKRLPVWWRKKGSSGELPPAARLRPVIDAIEQGRMRVEALERALDLLLDDPDAPVAEVVATRSKRGDEDVELSRAVEATRSAVDSPRGKSRDVVMRWAMGRVMPKLLGRIAPGHVEGALGSALEGMWT